MPYPEFGASPPGDSDRKREAVLHVMAAAAFLVFFQAYLVAPLIPSLSIEFHASTDFLGLLVPAYMLPYGISTLFYGPISDRFGRKPVILTLLGLMVVSFAGVASSTTAVQMMVWRLLGGAITGGTVPIALALLGRSLSVRATRTAPGMDFWRGGWRHGLWINLRSVSEPHHWMAKRVPDRSWFQCSGSGVSVSCASFY